jgi:putative protein kinase ArgK-like GTPase of G3E family
MSNAIVGVDALLLVGAPGAGKSSVLAALGTLLELDGVQHGAIETVRGRRRGDRHRRARRPSRSRARSSPRCERAGCCERLGSTT